MTKKKTKMPRVTAKEAAAQLLLDTMLGTVLWGITDSRSSIHHLIGDDDAILEALGQKTASENRLNAVRGEMGALLEPFIDMLVSISEAEIYSPELSKLMRLHGEIIKPKKTA